MVVDLDETGNSRPASDEEQKILEELEALRNVRVRITIEVLGPAEGENHGL